MVSGLNVKIGSLSELRMCKVKDKKSAVKRACSFFGDFNVSGVEEGEVQEVNYRITIKVGAGAPVRLAAISLEPIR